MTLPPEVIHKIDDLMRGDLQYLRDEYFDRLLYSTYLVIVGVALEGPEVVRDAIDLFAKSDREKKTPKWIKFVALVGWLFVVFGVAGEAYFDAKVSNGDTQLQAFNTSLLLEAQRESANAERRAANAILFAGEASDSAMKATDSARQSESLARGARQEADSFENDIKSAKEQAAKAESDLAEALRRAADAMEALNRLTARRTLSNVSKLTSTLKQFKDTEYVFSSVFADEESTDLLKSIDDALQLAGWKRGKPVGGTISVSVALGENLYPIPPAVTDGIRISVQSPIEYPTLRNLRDWVLPESVRAAIALRSSLIDSLRPPEEGPAKVNIDKGESKTVFISIGKKK